MKIKFYINKTLVTSATIHEDLLQYKSSGLITGTEKLLGEEWITLAQIIKKEEQDINFISQNNKSSESLDSIIAQIIPAFQEASKFLEEKTPLEIIPIAIYREL
ncbi:MAG: hypothetical protein PHG41_07410 [Actinomycetota bacterium]|nr:hypothetical protein [Actinomycetota bacterium]